VERLADAALDRAHTRFIVTSNPEECAARIEAYADLGFNHLVFHAPGADQARFLDQFAADVLPILNQRLRPNEGLADLLPIGVSK
jgi:coenzyme F420-dependent glucose-6-phosphate dehydrogenase